MFLVFGGERNIHGLARGTDEGVTVYIIHSGRNEGALHGLGGAWIMDGRIKGGTTVVLFRLIRKKRLEQEQNMIGANLSAPLYIQDCPNLILH